MPNGDDMTHPASRPIPPPETATLTRRQLAEIVRAFLLTYTVDRLGRPASVTSRAAAFDALDQLEER